MSKEVKITKARTFEIDPNKKYVIILPAEQMSHDDAAKLNMQFGKWGAESIVLLSTDPEAVKIIETEAKKWPRTN